MNEPGLTAKVLALHSALADADLAHAFGGALALAFCVGEPRATKDVDLNVFISPDAVERLTDALPPEVEVTEADRLRLRRDGQTRLWWGRNPVDVFLSNHPFHDRAAANRRLVPFAGIQLPVLACADLAVFKAFFARPKDAIDIASMVSAEAVSLQGLQETVTALLGDGDREDFFALVDRAVRG